MKAIPTRFLTRLACNYKNSKLGRLSSLSPLLNSTVARLVVARCLSAFDLRTLLALISRGFFSNLYHPRNTRAYVACIISLGFLRNGHTSFHHSVTSLINYASTLTNLSIVVSIKHRLAAITGETRESLAKVTIISHPRTRVTYVRTYVLVTR